MSIIEKQRKMLQKEMEDEKKRLADQGNKDKVFINNSKGTVFGVCPP